MIKFKYIKIIVICFSILLIMSQNIFALDEILELGKKWDELGKENEKSTFDTDILKKGASNLYNVLLAVATAVALIVGAILGIKYMTAGLSEKVDVKESLIPYLVSCIIVFGSFGIWKLVVTILKSV